MELSTNQAIDQVIESAVKDQAEKAPGLRQVHAKSHGCVWGEFTVAQNIPETMRFGIFSTVKTYPIWVRFSNASGPLSQGQLQSDTLPDGRGMAIKLMQVEGKKVLDDEQSTQDFVFINNPFFFVRDAQGYVRLAEAATGKLAAESVAYEFGILQQMGGKKTRNPLRIQYWSATPFRLGSNAVKLSAKPHLIDDLSAPVPESENYLREAMVNYLTLEKKAESRRVFTTGVPPVDGELFKTDAYFDFMIQLQPGDDPKLVEDPTIPWDETVSPYIKVATIKLPAQEFDPPERKQFDQSLSFTPWHTLPEHEPLGSVNQARLKLYQTIAKNRRDYNQMPIAEPQPYQPS